MVDNVLNANGPFVRSIPFITDKIVQELNKCNFKIAILLIKCYTLYLQSSIAILCKGLLFLPICCKCVQCMASAS